MRKDRKVRTWYLAAGLGWRVGVSGAVPEEEQMWGRYFSQSHSCTR